MNLWHAPQWRSIKFRFKSKLHKLHTVRRAVLLILRYRVVLPAVPGIFIIYKHQTHDNHIHVPRA